MKPLKVTAAENDMRLDLFLAKRMELSRKKAKELIDQGRVFLGQKKIIIASWQVKTGETIEIKDPKDAGLLRRHRYLKVYFEDSDLLVVEKPPQVACERSAQTLTSTLVDDINDYLRRAHPQKKYPYLGLMHRLDRETSGLMVYSLSKPGNQLADQFRRHRIGRRYQALVEGSLKGGEGRVDLPIGKDPGSKGRKMKAFRGGSGKGITKAITDFRILERYPTVTLIEARLLTGRTHQVRVHLASLGHPVVGDRLYGSNLAVPRQMLHANFLEFRHPITSKKMTFRSPPPKDFREFLERLRKNSLRIR